MKVIVFCFSQSKKELSGDMQIVGSLGGEMHLHRGPHKFKDRHSCFQSPEERCVGSLARAEGRGPLALLRDPP